MEQMTRRAHSISLLRDHLVFCPKYRGRVLIGRVQKQMELITHQVCAEMGVEIIKMAVNPEHVHIYFKYPPNLSPSEIARKIKGVSSRRLRQRFHWLKDFCPGHLWAPSCFHGSVGHGSEVVENYIKNQVVS